VSYSVVLVWLSKFLVLVIGTSLSKLHCSVVNGEISVYLYGGQLSAYYSLMSNYSNKLRKIQMHLRNCAIIHVDSKIKFIQFVHGYR